MNLTNDLTNNEREINGKKKEKKNNFFLFVRPLNINIFGCNFIRLSDIGQWDKIGGQSSENAKKKTIFQFNNTAIQVNICNHRLLRNSSLLFKGNMAYLS